MAEALVWHLIRDNNSFLVKRNRTSRNGAVQFSSEPGNILNVNTFKYSGIANTRTIDIAQVNDTVVMKTKVPKNLQKPSKSIEIKVLGARKDSKAAIEKDTYRVDLAKAAAKRYSKLYTATKYKKGTTAKAMKTKRSNLKK